MFGQKRYISIFSGIISVCFSLGVSAQTVAETYAFANLEVKAGHYETAIKSYSRVLFFGDSEYKPECYARIALCYVLTGQYKEASRYYELAFKAFDNDSIRYELLFNKTNALLQERNFQEALIELYSLPDELPLHFELKRNFYLGVTQFGLNEFDEAEQHFRTLLVDTIKHQHLAALITKAHRSKRPNPKTARVLSMIIPGLGQFYTGHVKEGLNSLLLTSSFLALTVTTAVSYNFLDAFLAVSPWYTRYYVGGVINADRLARDKQAHKKSKVYEDILRLILKGT